MIKKREKRFACTTLVLLLIAATLPAACRQSNNSFSKHYNKARALFNKYSTVTTPLFTFYFSKKIGLKRSLKIGSTSIVTAGFLSSKNKKIKRYLYDCNLIAGPILSIPYAWKNIKTKSPKVAKIVTKIGTKTVVEPLTGKKGCAQFKLERLTNFGFATKSIFSRMFLGFRRIFYPLCVVNCMLESVRLAKNYWATYKNRRKKC